MDVSVVNVLQVKKPTDQLRSPVSREVVKLQLNSISSSHKYLLNHLLPFCENNFLLHFIEPVVFAKNRLIIIQAISHRMIAIFYYSREIYGFQRELDVVLNTY